MKITRFEEFIERAVPYFIGLVILVILLVMGSCDNQRMINNNIETVEVDGCEYLAANIGGNSALFTHKGNCKNHKPCE